MMTYTNAHQLHRSVCIKSHGDLKQLCCQPHPGAQQRSAVTCRFLAVGSGAVHYPRYTVQRTRAVFSSRQHVLDYQAALKLAAQVDTALEVWLTLPVCNSHMRIAASTETATMCGTDELVGNASTLSSRQLARCLAAWMHPLSATCISTLQGTLF